MFLYKKFLGIDLGTLNYAPSTRPKTLPTVFSHDEAILVISKLVGIHKLAVNLMYGSGLRVMESVRLRVQDVDFANACIMVREAKGQKWRRTLLPQSILSQLRMQIDYALATHQNDLEDGFGEAYLPNALARKYPKAAINPAWQYIFPSKNLSIDHRSNKVRRHHIGEQQVQRSVKKAITQAKIYKKAGCHHCCPIKFS